MNKKHIIIVGAGPGGLTSAMILSHRGYKVTIYEKEATVGGRSASLKVGDYTFDTGPTFLMMTFVLREMFEEAGRKLEDYCTVIPLDPMYKLAFKDFVLYPSTDPKKMAEQIDTIFPGNKGGLAKFARVEKKRFERMYPCLQIPYGRFRSMFSGPIVKAYPYLSLGRSLFGVLGDYFKDENLRIAYTFQAKYLGMSPWECPAAFAIIPYLEHTFGIDHVIGGLSAISDSMEKVCRESDVSIHCSSPVKKIIVENRVAKGIELTNGEKITADAVVINADFGYAMGNLFDKGIIRKWRPSKLRKKKYSCSTFMLYLGLDKVYDEPHHQILFANDYKANINDVVKHNRLSEDMSVYIRNASVTDKTLAPESHSAVYVLVPVPNTKREINWDDSQVQNFRSRVLKKIAERTSMKDLEDHIVEEKILTPQNWEQDYNLFLGATFNLGHTIDQMLVFRPHNKFEEVDKCYLVGGGTHPGSGLPTIYESARISSNIICKEIV